MLNFKEELISYISDGTDTNNYGNIDFGVMVHALVSMRNLAKKHELDFNDIFEESGSQYKKMILKNTPGPEIEAHLSSDEGDNEVKFNAGVWFNQASDNDIKELKNCNWGKDYAADEVALFSREFDPKVAEVFNYIDEKQYGFECKINEKDAKAWIKKNAPHLFKEIFS